ncbi:MAG: hypothetical protein K0V04_33010 [Deltaproteobacteria bacterium]|nr:hypothetical protein [Deltaproteobacteria bacterium]
MSDTSTPSPTEIFGPNGDQIATAMCLLCDSQEASVNPRLAHEAYGVAIQSCLTNREYVAERGTHLLRHCATEDPATTAMNVLAAVAGMFARSMAKDDDYAIVSTLATLAAGVGMADPSEVFGR